jgi:hypothetical protein
VLQRVAVPHTHAAPVLPRDALASPLHVAERQRVAALLPRVAVRRA